MPFGSWKTICRSRMMSMPRLLQRLGDIHTQEVDLPAVQRFQPDDGSRHRAFAAARFADDAQGASALDGEADIVEART